MPAIEPCPHCGETILDWHIEWLPEGAAPKVFRGEIAADCPICREGIRFDGRSVVDLPDKQIVRRDVRKAARWCRGGAQNVGGTLADYLANSPAGQQYAGYFDSSDVTVADQMAGQQP